MGYIGYVHFPFLSEYRQKRVVGIYGMQVYAPFRCQGIATSLIGYLQDRACEQSVQEILVGTTVENTAARQTYETGGMRPVAFRTGTMYRYPH
jgi:GNAT superfamily N-acetyltransferase